MNTVVLICPSSRPGVQQLAPFAPLAAIPLLGATLVEYWLTHLAANGEQCVRILANDRPEVIRALVGTGARWGLQAEVIAESRELTAAQAQLKYEDAQHQNIFVLDHFPGSPQLPVFGSCADFFAAVMGWLPQALTADRVGIREVAPGIRVGLHARVSSQAQLHAPCWIGRNAYVGPRAVVGPMAVLEDRAFVEPDAEIAGSIIGPDTFVGRLSALHESIAWGNTLINWKSGLSAAVSDSFLLCALRRPSGTPVHQKVQARISELYSRNKVDLQMFWKHLLTNKEG